MEEIETGGDGGRERAVDEVVGEGDVRKGGEIAEESREGAAEVG